MKLSYVILIKLNVMTKFLYYLVIPKIIIWYNKLITYYGDKQYRFYLEMSIMI